MRIGITGHCNLTAASMHLVQRALADELEALRGAEVTGVSCLAKGADQIFASAVLEIGGALEVVLPAADYRERKVEPDNAAGFDELIGKAATVRTMPFAASSRTAYMAASEFLLDSVEAVIAVWDGRPSGGHGGTGAVVEAAHRRGVPVTVLWPEGAERA
ncbi:hypothetical protein [Saccharopolyspora mangrovi]|uniref:Uncharacterized protein n=1 Tax=Saccharopolyspora mangrovi TaxID=3082379 RepID=A0ABU6AKT1_9PSEU|nr:hypothetical protein [Saccharopolyspora sp. S2-29]MEB3372147.1 hypothetical protein [Saccharopolyspora sp. S2-29]